jgi:hypothetical protein
MNDDDKMRGWERRFPALDAEWNYWWIEGDGVLLAVVGPDDLLAALEIMRTHRERASPCRLLSRPPLNGSIVGWTESSGRSNCAVCLERSAPESSSDANRPSQCAFRKARRWTHRNSSLRNRAAEAGVRPRAAA